jgi:hypothetical protein
MFTKKLKVVEMYEKKSNAKITIKMINKLLSEFNLIAKIAPRPIEYNKLRPSKFKKLGGFQTSLKRTQITYSHDLLNLLQFLINTNSSKPFENLKNSKLYTIMERVLLISDQENPEVNDLRTSSFKCLKDFLENLLKEFTKFDYQIQYEIITFLFYISQIVRQLIFENSEQRMINKEVFLILMMQLLNPLDRVYKLLRNFVIHDTKELVCLNPSQMKAFYHTIIFSKSLFTLFSSQSELDIIARKNDALVPPMDDENQYNVLVSLNELFVYEIMSIPRTSHFIYIMLKKKDFSNVDDVNESKCYSEMIGQLDDLNFKNLFKSFYFSKLSRKTDQTEYEEEKMESSSELSGTLLPEGMKSEKKMHIFVNLFNLLQKLFIKEMPDYVDTTM